MYCYRHTSHKNTSYLWRPNKQRYWHLHRRVISSKHHDDDEARSVEPTADRNKSCQKSSVKWSQLQLYTTSAEWCNDAGSSCWNSTLYPYCSRCIHERTSWACNRRWWSLLIMCYESRWTQRRRRSWWHYRVRRGRPVGQPAINESAEAIHRSWSVRRQRYRNFFTRLIPIKVAVDFRSVVLTFGVGLQSVNVSQGFWRLAAVMINTFNKTC